MYFNPTIVRLKPVMAAVEEFNKLFQSYNSSIKTKGCWGEKDLVDIFQSYNSSIKTVDDNGEYMMSFGFQSYNSSIKTVAYSTLRKIARPISILQ